MKTIKNLKAEEIRKSILQLAIQGKLVKQDPNDEPASELVKRIYAEKQRLIKEGKIKKDKNESFIFKGDDNCYYEKIGNSEPVKLEDLPFDIPDSWTWIRLKNISEYGMGQTILTKEMSNEGTPVFSATIDDKPLGFIPESDNKIKLTIDDLVIPARGNSIGYVTHIKDETASCTQTTIWMKLYDKEIVNFLLCFFKGYKDKLFIFSGGAIPQVTITMMKNYLMPLPPIQEQVRIANKINLFAPLLEKYGITEENLSKLEETFPEKLKKSILQYAIEGKLVKQDPNDEPASVLLERIKAEKEKLVKEGKIKRDKNESYIYQGDDKNYYEKIDSKLIPCDETTQINLPINWAFCYFGNVSTYGYTTTKMQPILNSWLLELEDIVSGSSVVKTRKYVEENTNLNSKVPFKSGMVLYSKLRPYLDKIVIADQDGIATSEIVPFYSLIDTDYLVTFLRSPYFLNRVTNLMYGVKMPRLGTQDMTMTIIPLPPLSEQKRIVKKILSINEIISG